MTKKEKIIEKKLKWNSFIENTLPIIKTKYSVILFEHHSQIINNDNKSFDYYPKPGNVFTGSVKK